MFRPPPKVVMQDIQQNGKLLNDQQIQIVKALFKANPNLTRIDNEAINGVNYKEQLGFAVEKFIADDGTVKYCAIYYGVQKSKALGEGGLGKVKIAQDLDSGKFYALKIADGEDKVKDAEKEFRILSRLKKADGKAEREGIKGVKGKRGKKPQFLFIMDLAPGDDIEKLIKNREKYSIEIKYGGSNKPTHVDSNKLKLCVHNAPDGSTSLSCYAEVDKEIIEISLSNLTQDMKDRIINDVMSDRTMKAQLTDKQTAAIFKITSKKGFTPISPQKRREQLANQVPLTSIDELLTVSIDILKDASNIYNHGIIFRDHKTQNMMYDTETKTLTIIDFGSAVDKNNALLEYRNGVTAIYIPNEVPDKCITNAADIVHAKLNKNNSLWTNGVIPIRWSYPSKNKPYTFSDTILLMEPNYIIGYENGKWSIAYYESGKRVTFQNDALIDELNKLMPDPANFNFNRMDDKDKAEKLRKDQNMIEEKLKLSHVKNRVETKFKTITDEELNAHLQAVKNYLRDKETESLFNFNESTDVYALGLTIGQLFNLTKQSKRDGIDDSEFGNCFAIVNDVELKAKYANGDILLSPFILDTVVQLLRSMTSQDPNQRPTHAQALGCFNAIRSYNNQIIVKIYELSSLQELTQHIHSIPGKSKRKDYIFNYFDLIKNGDPMWFKQLADACSLIEKNPDRTAWTAQLRSQIEETGLIGKFLTNSKASAIETQLIIQFHDEIVKFKNLDLSRSLDEIRKENISKSKQSSNSSSLLSNSSQSRSATVTSTTTATTAMPVSTATTTTVTNTPSSSSSILTPQQQSQSQPVSVPRKKLGDVFSVARNVQKVQTETPPSANTSPTTTTTTTTQPQEAQVFQSTKAKLHNVLPVKQISITNPFIEVSNDPAEICTMIIANQADTHYWNNAKTEWLPALNFSIKDLAFSLTDQKHRSQIVRFLHSDLLINELNALERAQFILKHKELYVELRKEEAKRHKQIVATGAKTKEIKNLAQLEANSSSVSSNNNIHEVDKILEQIVPPPQAQKGDQTQNQPHENQETSISNTVMRSSKS